MAHLWVENTGSWEALKLNGAEHRLPGSAPPGVAETEFGRQEARLMRVGKDGAQAWVLSAAAGSDIRVNGRTVNAGLWALANKDEIRAREKRLYFSNETVAEVVPFPGVGRPVFCGRCRLPIAAESPAVCCPGCGIWHHQGGHDNRLCWTYAPACSCCDSQTELGSGLTWVPEEDATR